MLRYMITNYMRAYRWSNLKEHIKINFSMLFFTDWWLLSMIGKLLFEGNSGIHDYIAILAIYLPMMHAHFSGGLHSIELSKMMHLCPMNTVERTAYIHNFYYFRVLLHMAISVAGVVVLFLLTCCNTISAAIILCNDLTISLSAICRKTKEYNSNDLPPRWGTKMAILLAALISNTAQLADITDNKPPHMTLQLILLGVLLCMQLPLSFSFHKYVKAELTAAANYEENRGIS